MEWQGIESAPKDGRRVLLWSKAWSAASTGQFYGVLGWMVLLLDYGDLIDGARLAHGERYSAGKAGEEGASIRRYSDAYRKPISGTALEGNRKTLRYSL